MIEGSKRTAPRYTIAIDLDGTFLTEKEGSRPWVPPDQQHKLAAYMERLRGRAQFVTCTGHDIRFVLEVLTPELFPLFEGHVLESGSAIYSQGRLHLLPTPSELERIWEKWEAVKGEVDRITDPHFNPGGNTPDGRLREAVDYMPHRDASITVFAKKGEDDTVTQRHLGTILDFMATQLGDSPASGGEGESEREVGAYRVAKSSVAVDAVYTGYSKWNGLKSLAGGSTTIGIGDSGNDRVLHRNVGLACAPHNLKKAKAYVEELKKENREFWVIRSETLKASSCSPRVTQARWVAESFAYERDLEQSKAEHIAISQLSDLPAGLLISEEDKTETKGVVDVLRFLDRVLE